MNDTHPLDSTRRMASDALERASNTVKGLRSGVSERASVAQRYLEINGTWEDHIRYAMTVEEWDARRDDLMTDWIA